MSIEEYLDSLRGRTVAVIGVGVSNQPLIELLLSHGVSVTARDRKEDLGPAGEHLAALGARLRLGEDYLGDLREDVIFRTPGMRPDLPALSAAVAAGSRLTSEMEVFLEVCPCPVLAVTGSDGKTTTTTIIAELLKAADRTVHVGGNIGHPLLSEAGTMAPEDLAVLELSSFQLMTMTRSPHVAVVTNLAPNHLDVHRISRSISLQRKISLRTKGPRMLPSSTPTTTSPPPRRRGPWAGPGSSPAGGRSPTASSSGGRPSSPGPGPGAAGDDRGGYPSPGVHNVGELPGGHRRGGRPGARRDHPDLCPGIWRGGAPDRAGADPKGRAVVQRLHRLQPQPDHRRTQRL